MHGLAHWTPCHGIHASTIWPELLRLMQYVEASR